jgi:hypothetical protein
LSATFTLDSVPANVMVASPVPVPAEKLRPLWVGSEISVPLLAVSDTTTAAPSRSTSVTEMVLNVRGASSVADCVVVGTLLTGGSLNEVTARVSTSRSLSPLVSLALRVKDDGPAKFAVGV